ncbi:MAG: CoA-binding protein [Chloroflexota bacterium]
MTAEERRRARDMLDLQEGTGPVPVLDADGALALLRGTRRIAIVGASTNPDRPGSFVMRSLQAAGFDCVPVNPFATEVNGVPAFPTLAAATAATGRFDLVDVFRRPEHCADVARAAVEVGAGALWLQIGIVSWEAARIAHEAGLPVVMDRCTAVDARRLPPRKG